MAYSAYNAHGLILTKDALYHLSYIGKLLLWCVSPESNRALLLFRQALAHVS